MSHPTGFRRTLLQLAAFASQRRALGCAAVERISMSSSRISVLAVAIILGGCSANTNSRVGEDPPIWGRVDCQRGEGNSELQKEFDDAKATCLARGETAAAVAGTAGNSTCMSEQGYVLRTRAEHMAACQALEEQKSKPTTGTKKPKKSKGNVAKSSATPERTEPAAPEKQ
jgi:hypothetical protein